MDQASFAFATRPAAAADRCGFEIGWDHATHGLVPPPALLDGAASVAQGWHAARAVLGCSRRPGSAALREWLGLRLQAWRQGLPFDTAGLSADALAGLAVRRCPVTRQPLGGAPQDALAATHLCLDPRRGHALGHTVVLSRVAAQAAASLDVAALWQRARVADLGAATPTPAATGTTDTREHDRSGFALDATAWRRLALLRSFATSLPFTTAAALPLVLLPPPAVRPCNPVQALQAGLTLQFASPGWAGRLRRLAATLCDPAQRQDLNLLVGALAPRVLEAGASGAAPGAGEMRTALEDAWQHERVLRRWQAWVLGLGEAGVQRMLDRLGQMGAVDALAAAPLRQHAPRPRGPAALPAPARAPSWPGTAPGAAEPSRNHRPDDADPVDAERERDAGSGANRLSDAVRAATARRIRRPAGPRSPWPPAPPRPPGPGPANRRPQI